MEIFLNFISYIDFFIQCILTTILGLIIGYTNRKLIGVKNILYCGLVSLLISVPVSIFYTSSFKSTIVLPAIIIGFCLFMSALILFQFQKQFSIHLNMSFLLSAINGLLIGLNYTLFSVTFVLLLFIFITIWNQLNNKFSHRYCIYIEFSAFSLIEKIDHLLNVFQLPIVDKQLTKTNTFTIIMSYDSSRVIHHLFLKKLLSFKGIHKVSCI
ncbi:hypothetical protein DID75_00645 [Candidatus Marinamargulisbacteria bacterium SCGC AG-410-N11]|nr:hypothetical protein DID75_00645 [Candidatus Marinamargulisbacteria bacterium SCGC AG-410-N11]